MTDGRFAAPTLMHALYSGKARASSAPFYPAMLAQARSDVFFSLLFGHGVISTAESFFDSPIALRIFGELFTAIEPRFWVDAEVRPLQLYLESPVGADDPVDFLAWRWADERLYFSMLRGEDPSIPKAVQLSARRAAIAALTRKGGPSFQELNLAFQPLSETKHTFDPAPGFGEDTAKYDPLIGAETGFWYKVILENLRATGGYGATPPDILAAVRANFSLAESLDRRTSHLAEHNPDKDFVGRLRERHRIYLEKENAGTRISVLQTTGPDIYREQYEMVRKWAETDYHLSRQRSYGIANCIISSDYLDKEHVGDDINSKSFYLANEILQESRTVQERYFKIEWAVLKEILTDRAWQTAVTGIKLAHGGDVSRHVETILNILVRKLTSYEVLLGAGDVSLVGKEAISSAEATVKSAFGHVQALTLFDNASDLFSSSAPVAGRLGKYATRKAFKSVLTWSNRRQLEKFLVPAVYALEAN